MGALLLAKEFVILCIAINLKHSQVLRLSSLLKNTPKAAVGTMKERRWQHYDEIQVGLCCKKGIVDIVHIYSLNRGSPKISKSICVHLFCISSS